MQLQDTHSLFQGYKCGTIDISESNFKSPSLGISAFTFLNVLMLFFFDSFAAFKELLHHTHL